MDVVTEWMRDEDTEEADDPLWRLQNWVADIKGRKTLAASETIHPSSQPASYPFYNSRSGVAGAYPRHTYNKQAKKKCQTLIVVIYALK